MGEIGGGSDNRIQNESGGRKFWKRRSRAERAADAALREQQQRNQAIINERLRNPAAARRDAQAFRESLALDRILRLPPGAANMVIRAILFERAGDDTYERKVLDVRLRDPWVTSTIGRDGKAVHHCTGCGKFANPWFGCRHCRHEALGVPRKLATEVVREIQSDMARLRRTPRMDDVLGRYLREIHQPVRHSVITANIRTRPPRVSERAWNEMSWQERQAVSPMVCIWLGREGKGGYVAQSKTSYGDLMRRWNETGTPPYANPDEFTSLGIQAGYAEVSERYGHQFREGPLPPDVRIWIVPVDQNGHTTGEKEEMTIRELRKRYFGSLEE